MSGDAIPAISDPSAKAMSPWTIDWGWTTTSSRSAGRPNRWWASISSSPLFMRPAESIVTFRPITQFGWASACSRVAAEMRSALHSRNGPARRGDGHCLDRGRIARADRLKQGVVLGVHRQDHRTRAPRGLHHRRAGAHQRFLVGERNRAPGGDRGEGRPQSRRADDRGNHQIGLAQRGFLDRLRAGGDFEPESPPGQPSDLDSRRDRPARRILRRARSRISPAPRRRARRDRATTENLSGAAAMTCAQERPIEPVAPRIDSRLGARRRPRDRRGRA